MSSKLKAYFNDMKVSNKIGHAFLIGNEIFENIKESLNEVISEFIFNEETDVMNNLDVHIIIPNGMIITKDQILDLQVSLKTTSQIHDKKVYIITESEKMNAYAANSLLKILEEPGRDIYAFLITSNINKVMETIKSRCQIIFLSSEVNLENIYQKMDEEIFLKAINIINVVEEYKTEAIAYISEYISKSFEKKDLKNILSIVEYFYRDLLNYKLNKNIEYFVNDIDLIKSIADKNEIKQITSKILIINRINSELEYNLNLNLILDKIIIEFGRC